MGPTGCGERDAGFGVRGSGFGVRGAGRWCLTVAVSALIALLPFTARAQDESAAPVRPWKLPDWWSNPDAGHYGDEAWLEDPFGAIGGDMRTASGDLHEGHTEPPVSVTHPRVEQRLEQLIAMLEKQCQGTGSGGGGNPSRPAARSTLRSGADKQGPLTDPTASNRAWAQLTPKDREKIEQARGEGFPAGFEDVLADYFLRLAQEEESAESARPTPRDASPNSPTRPTRP